MRVVILALMLVGLMSCKRVESGNISDIGRVSINTMSAHEFTYKGHSYIWFHNSNGGWDGNDGIVHNPDCPCKRK